MHAMHRVWLVFFLVAVGCARMERTPPASAAPPTETVAAVEPSKTGSATQSVAKIEAPAAKTPAQRPTEQPGKKPGATPSSGKSGTPPLDLTALETRLKETKAIGVFTKIALKNQVDDLLNQFRAHYQGRVKTSLAELRPAYDRLLLKVLSLCQDGDPELARAIVSSREAIWSILADPAKFATL